MSALLSTFIVGVSLSMDAFSMSLAYGTVGISLKQKLLLSVIVGIFHFIMPLIGLCFGGFITNHFIINVNLLVSIIFGIIGVEMIVSSIRDEEIQILVSILGFLLFALSVSIDSFTTGIGIEAINDNYLQVSTIFALVSGCFTYLGLNFGVKLNKNYGKYSTFIGGVVLIMLGVYYLV